MESAKVSVGMVVAAFAAVAMLVLLVVFGVWLYQQFEGGLLSQQYQNVKHSQAYVESTNSQMRELMTEYAKAETGYLTYSKTDPVTAASYQGQMTATLNQLYALAGTLSPSEVAPDVQNFLATHPQFR